MDTWSIDKLLFVLETINSYRYSDDIVGDIEELEGTYDRLHPEECED